MREIKFRAWDKKEKKWIKEKLLLLSESGKLYKLLGDNSGVEYYDMKYIDIVFFTGLKDKNEKEIYEGEILTNEINNYECIFWKGCFVAKLIGQKKKNQGYLALEILEKIGNIYENPELLEKSK